MKVKINKIILENFRTFYGKHTIEFSTNNDKPVTIFIGENGSGKTTMLNAIYWAFTGGTTKQFGESNILINKDAIVDKNAICSVELYFETDIHKYILTRKSIRTTETSELSLGTIDKNGAYTGIGSMHINKVIERLIPKKLASWYIFDGEAIGHLHLSGDSKFKEELQQTFGFSSMKYLSELISEIVKDYEREQRKQIGNAQLDDIGNKIEHCDSSIILYENQISSLQTTKENALNEIESFKYQLSKFSRAEPLQARATNAARLINEHKIKLSNKILQRNDLVIKNLSQLLINDKLTNLIDTLHQKEKDQSLPEPFGTRLIDDIQKMRACICGTPVLPGSDVFNRLEELRSRAATSQHLHRISLIRAQIGAYVGDSREFDARLSQISADIGLHETAIADQEQIIRNTDEAIRAIPDEEIKKLKSELTKLELKKDQAVGEIAVNIARRDERKVELVKLRNLQDSMLASLSRNNNLAKQKTKFDELSKFVDAQYTRQEREVLDALNKEVSGVLYKYLTKNFNAQIDPNTYAVKTFDMDSRAVPLSTGETNLLKFAVIAAIVGMAGSRTKISKVNWITEPIIAPLIFDAPFSVVDSEYRAGIANNLTELASQLIFLFDSDKWDVDLSNLLSSRVGKFYTLVSRAKGAQKDTQKFLKINGKTLKLNEYDSQRDESVCVEVKL
jgi:DNA sulfur modification protein DndD